MDELQGLQPQSTQSKNKNKKASGWPDACVRIAEIAALTGNFLPLIILAVIALVVWRLTSADLKTILSDLVNARWFAVLGWVSFGLSVLLSINFFRWKDRVHQREIDRCAEVKKAAVQEKFALELQSSNRKHES